MSPVGDAAAVAAACSATADVVGAVVLVSLRRATCELLGVAIAAGDDVDGVRTLRVTAGDAVAEGVAGSAIVACDGARDVDRVRATAAEVASVFGVAWLLGADDGATAAAIVATSGRVVARVRWLAIGVGVWANVGWGSVGCSRCCEVAGTAAVEVGVGCVATRSTCGLAVACCVAVVLAGANSWGRVCRATLGGTLESTCVRGTACGVASRRGMVGTAAVVACGLACSVRRARWIRGCSACAVVSGIVMAGLGCVSLARRCNCESCEATAAGCGVCCEAGWGCSTR